MASLKNLVIRGTIWTLAGYGTSQILRFGGNIILTRLLVPEFFGLMAVVNTLRIGLELFSDIGISQVIVNSKRGDEPVFLNTAWTLGIVRSLILWILCLLITWPMTKFYHDDRFFWLIPLTGLSSVFDGLSSSSINTLQRQMSLGKITVFNLVIQILSLSTLILLAYWSHDIVVLAIGVVLGAVYKMIGSYWLIPGYFNRFAWDQDAVNEILSFGKWMFLASGVTFLNEQSDRLILAKLLSFKLLGVYTVAYTLAGMPREVIKTLSHRVIFPAMASQIDLPRSTLRAKILHQRRFIIMGFAVLLATLVASGDLVIGLIYDNRYQQATWMMPILCCGIWISVLFYTISPVLIALGKPLYSAQSNLAGFLVISVGLPLAFFSYGVVGAITLIALSDLPLYIVNLYGLGREKLSCFSQDMQMTAFFAGILGLFLTFRSHLGLGLPIQGIL